MKPYAVKLVTFDEKHYKVRLVVGVQSFTIESGDSKTEAAWMAKMLRIALGKIEQAPPAHSMSEHRRLTAQGAASKPPRKK